MNAPNVPASGPLSPEAYEEIREVFEPMRNKFAAIAASLPPEARPALTFGVVSNHDRKGVAGAKS